MKKKSVCIPKWCPKAIGQFLESPVGIIASNWILQGTRYMNNYERLHRLGSELVLLCSMQAFISITSNQIANLVFLALVIHTIYWVFNGHIYVMMRYLSDIKFERSKVKSHILAIYSRLEKNSSVQSAVAFGSFSRGNASLSADFDLRLVSKPGIRAWINTLNLCAMERARAFIAGFPLDIYVFTMDDFERKIRGDEPAVILVDRSGSFSQYPAGTVSFADLLNGLE